MGGRSNKSNVVQLDPEEIDRIETEVGEIMAAVPARIWDGRSLPVPIDLIASEVYGLKIREVSQDQMKEATGEVSIEGTISGLLLTSIGEIWVYDWEAMHEVWGATRRRFTIGHELGHFVMHQTGKPAIYCRVSEADEGQEGVHTTYPIPEAEANSFSAALLMPADLVRAEIGSGKVDENRLLSLRELFEASDKAMRRRVRAVQAIG
ncbi:MAG: ImmA/IrrE family metallo-endopeptidase [Solirubrobacterales bacterium]|nr:ImmA/IrrE family metallo-endopeptidase [Solirubrobacterales bacterium]MCB0870562.1 ImmA/IrrE family metallo-endopeptidase [Solirubrobacterales bacterium]